MNVMEDCNEGCEAMPECGECGLRKHPRGRDPGVAAANDYCGRDCHGYSDWPLSGHLWPGELKAARAPETDEP